MFKENKDTIYLDYAATTPISKKVVLKMQRYFSDEFGNPSSLHILGQKAQGAIDNARSDVADILNASWKEVYFLPSATESINLALRGIIKADMEVTKKKPHIITTNIEHSAVLNTCRELEAKGVEVTYLKANNDGMIDARQVKDSLKSNTVLVSVMYVNNEIGTIQPIKEISKILKDHQAYFHTDGVQATNYLDINVKELGVDLMSISGHKIYGPKGVGVLYKKESIKIEPIITGGQQERGLHAGTENVSAIAGFSQALKETQKIKESETARLEILRDKLIDQVLNSTNKISLNGSQHNRVVNNVNFSFEDKSSEALIPAFDEAGFYISSGSACTARVPEPSHVIEAIGKKDLAKSSIRISIGRGTSEEDINKTIQFIKNLI